MEGARFFNTRSGMVGSMMEKTPSLQFARAPNERVSPNLWKRQSSGRSFWSCHTRCALSASWQRRRDFGSAKFWASSGKTSTGSPCRWMSHDPLWMASSEIARPRHPGGRCQLMRSPLRNCWLGDGKPPMQSWKIGFSPAKRPRERLLFPVVPGWKGRNL